MTNKQASSIYKQLRALGLQQNHIARLCDCTPQAIWAADKRGWSLQLRDNLQIGIRKLITELEEIQRATARPNFQA